MFYSHHFASDCAHFWRGSLATFIRCPMDWGGRISRATGAFRGGESPERQTAEVQDFVAKRSYLNQGLASFDIDPEGELTELANVFATAREIPYRRRGYEGAAMLNHLLSICSLTSPTEVSNLSRGEIQHAQVVEKGTLVVYHQLHSDFEFTNHDSRAELYSDSARTWYWFRIIA